MRKLALDSCEKYQETLSKKSGPSLYDLFEGEVQAHQTAPVMDLNGARRGQEAFLLFQPTPIKEGNFLLLPLDEKAGSGDICK